MLIFKVGLDTYYNSGRSKEILKDYFFFDYFYPTAEPCCEVGNEMYELI
ncbi:GDSL family lipase [Wolbachia pipientis]|uniref:GDSL family lipase n=1 Tax=Wolbachia pipientis TaxID=955 RepID=A0A6C1U2K4_WOLPI|nr:GDSL family lipase [Wolbachia pipientis]